MRILFAGTPATALPTLRALLDSRHEVAAVLTRPDARAGRGRRLAPSPVAELAAEHGLPILRPASLKDPDSVAQLEAIGFDCAVVVAYGALLPPAVLRIAPQGWINVHFSLLPAWRGAAPVQHAIWAGDDIGGVTIFRIDEGLDTGPVLGRLTETIRRDDTTGSLLERLAAAGAELLVRSVDALEDGAIVPTPQGEDGVSRAPRIHVSDAEIDWEAPAYQIDRLVRAMTPEPGAWTTWRGARLKVRPGRAIDGDQLAPGELHADAHSVDVGTGAGAYRLAEVAPAAKSWMPAEAWARGARPEEGERLGEQLGERR